MELNRTQSNEIEHHNFSEFDFRTNRIQSNKSNSIELNPSDCVRVLLNKLIGFLKFPLPLSLLKVPNINVPNVTVHWFLH